MQFKINFSMKNGNLLSIVDSFKTEEEFIIFFDEVSSSLNKSELIKLRSDYNYSCLSIIPSEVAGIEFESELAMNPTIPNNGFAIPMKSIGDNSEDLDKIDKEAEQALRKIDRVLKETDSVNTSPRKKKRKLKKNKMKIDEPVIQETTMEYEEPSLNEETGVEVADDIEDELVIEEALPPPPPKELTPREKKVKSEIESDIESFYSFDDEDNTDGEE